MKTTCTGNVTSFIILLTAAALVAGETFELALFQLAGSLGQLNSEAMTLAIETANQLIAPQDALLLTATPPDACNATADFQQALALDTSNITAVIGPQCSASIIATSQYFGQHSIPSLSWSSSDPALFNATTFPFVFNLFPSDDLQTGAMRELVRSFGWQRLAILASSDVYGTAGAARLRELLPLLNVTIFPTPLFSQADSAADVLPTMRALKVNNIRLLLVFVHRAFVSVVFEAAFTAGLFGPGYVFLMSDGAGAADPYELISSADIAAAAEGALALRPAPALDSFEQVRYMQTYARRFPQSPTPSPSAQFIHDSVLVVAHGIRAARATVAPTGPISRAQLLAAMRGVDFPGVSNSRVKFVGNSLPLHSYALLNVQSQEYVQVATIKNVLGAEDSYLVDFTAAIAWSGGQTFAPTLRAYPVAFLYAQGIKNSVQAYNGVQLALQLLNSHDTDILQGDVLEQPAALFLNDNCDGPPGAVNVRIAATASDRPLALIGPLCSASAVQGAVVAASFQLPMISYDSTSVVLNDRAAFPFFVRTQPSALTEIVPLVRLVHAFGWQRVAVVSNDDVFSAGGASLIAQLAGEFGVTVTQMTPFTSGAGAAAVAPVVQQLQDADFKVVVLFLTVPEDVFAFLDAALSAGYFGKGIAFIASPEAIEGAFPEISDPKWAPLVEGMLSLQIQPTAALGSAWQAFVANYTAANFTQEPEASIYAAYAFDAVYLLARAVQALKARGGDPRDGALLEQQIYATKMNGATGPIFFDAEEGNERQGQPDQTFSVINYMNGAFVPVGIATQQAVNITSPITWQGGAQETPAACPQGTAAQLVRSSLQCVPCAANFYAAANSRTCTQCTSDQLCPFASSQPFELNPFWATSLALDELPNAGSLTAASTLNQLAISYGVAAGVISFCFLIVVIAVARVLGNDAKTSLRRFDLVFDLLHPTPVGTAAVRRRTAIGGLFSIEFCIISLLLFAYLIHRFAIDRFEVAQTSYPGLKAGVTAQYELSVELIGMDEPSVCAQACSLSSVNGVAGTFSCSADPAQAGCLVTFTASQPEVPLADSNVQFVFAGTRAQAVYYRSRSRFFGQRNFGVSGNVLPPADSVFFGAQPTNIVVLVQQSSITGADLLYPKEDGVVENVYGYGSYLVLAEPGASVNSSRYFVPQSSAFSASASNNRPLGVTINVEIQIGSGSTLLQVSEKDPDGVLLVSSICAFISGLFALSRGLLVLIEESFITVKRTQQAAKRRSEESFALEVARMPTRDRESTGAVKGTKAGVGTSAAAASADTEQDSKASAEPANDAAATEETAAEPANGHRKKSKSKRKSQSRDDGAAEAESAV